MPKSKKKSSKKKATKKKATKKKATKKKAVKTKVSKKKAKKKKAVKKKTVEEEIKPAEAEKEVVKVKPKKDSTAKRKEKIGHGLIPTPEVWPDHLTKYERSRIIGARALQISQGAPILVEALEKIGNPVEVAEKELTYGVLPLTIRRILPNGDIVDVALQDLLEND